MRFGRLLVETEVFGKRCKHGKVLWRCKCECGTLRVVRTGSLVAGNTRSCGCYRRDAIRAAAAKRRRGQHGHFAPELEPGDPE